jgi:hypothetical protein
MGLPIEFHLHTYLSKNCSLLQLLRAVSISAIVREALEHRLRLLREDMLSAEFEAAAKDPEFMSDIESTMHAFERSDEETARMIKP